MKILEGIRSTWYGSRDSSVVNYTERVSDPVNPYGDPYPRAHFAWYVLQYDGRMVGASPDGADPMEEINDWLLAEMCDRHTLDVPKGGP